MNEVWGPRKILFGLILLGLTYWIGSSLISYINAGLGALLFYFFLRDPMDILVTKKKWNQHWAVLFLLFVSFLVVMVPLGLMITMIGTKISSISSQIQETILLLEAFIRELESKYKVVVLSDSNLDSIAKFLSSLLSDSMGVLLDSMGSVVIMYFLLYYMLLQYRSMELWFFTKLPLQQQSIRLLGRELKELVMSNSIGLPITALAQGVLAGMLYAFLSVDDWWFWFVLTSFTAMIPAVGAALAYLPLAMILYAQGHENQAIILTIYGFTVIAAADNLVRMFLQKKMGDIHPLITILGVIVGLKLFGFLGLIFGPILLSFFRLLFKVYQIEFGDIKY